MKTRILYSFPYVLDREINRYLILIFQQSECPSMFTDDTPTGSVPENLQDSLSKRLNEVKDDPCLVNLYFRYFQNLELGESHWRESMQLDSFGCGVRNKTEATSKQKIEEEQIARNFPHQDANQLRLIQKYNRQNGD